MINADALVVKSPDGSNKKLFLSSLRPPRCVPITLSHPVWKIKCLSVKIFYLLSQMSHSIYGWFYIYRLPAREDGTQDQSSGNRRTRPLYDVPYMFEAREFMRKKLIGKKVRSDINKFMIFVCLNIIY